MHSQLDPFVSKLTIMPQTLNTGIKSHLSTVLFSFSHTMTPGYMWIACLLLLVALVALVLTTEEAKNSVQAHYKWVYWSLFGITNSYITIFNNSYNNNYYYYYHHHYYYYIVIIIIIIIFIIIIIIIIINIIIIIIILINFIIIILVVVVVV